MLYSKTTGGFYDLVINAGGIPADAVEIGAETYEALLAAQSAGKTIVGKKNGQPEAITPVVVVTWVGIRSQRNALLAASDWTQLGDSAANKPAWATYRQSLRDITKTFATPAAVVWPTLPA